jgi:hypothetical protein
VSAPDDKVVPLPGDANKPQPEQGRIDRSHDGPGHSDIFERLAAHDETDLVGLVAYGIYQRNKRAWIKAHQAKHGKYPSQAERDAFAFSHRESALIALRTQAEGALAAFGEQVVEEQIDALRTDALNAQSQAVLTGIDTKIGKLGSYWHHIVGHLAGFLVLVGIVALSSWIVSYEPSLEKAIHWLYGPSGQGGHPTGP